MIAPPRNAPWLALLLAACHAPAATSWPRDAGASDACPDGYVCPASGGISPGQTLQITPLESFPIYFGGASNVVEIRQHGQTPITVSADGGITTADGGRPSCADLRRAVVVAADTFRGMR